MKKPMLIAAALLFGLIFFCGDGEEQQTCDLTQGAFEAYEYPAYEYLTFRTNGDGSWEEVDAWGTRTRISFSYQSDDEMITFESHYPDETNRRRYTLERRGKQCVLTLDEPPFSWSIHVSWETLAD